MSWGIQLCRGSIKGVKPNVVRVPPLELVFCEVPDEVFLPSSEARSVASDFTPGPFYGVEMHIIRVAFCANIGRKDYFALFRMT
jgi:hypothetical protein